MISFISNWAESIIVAVFIASIIEMIIPNGNSKKYIKVVIGIYVLFVILTPFVNKFADNSFDIYSVFNYEAKQDAVEVSSNNLEEKNIMNIKSMYEINLKSDIKNKIQNKGYIVNDVTLDISDDDQYKINKINIEISGEADKQENAEKSGRKNIITIVDNIEKITVDLSKKDSIDTSEERYIISEKKVKYLKEYISNNYDVAEKDIQIN